MGWRSCRTSSTRTRASPSSWSGCSRPPPRALRAERPLAGRDAQPLRVARHCGELRDELERLVVVDESLQLCELRVEPDGIDRRLRRDEDLRMARRLCDL